MPISFNRQIDRAFANIRKGYDKAVTRASIASWQMAVDSTPAPPTPPFQRYKRTGRLRSGWKLNTGRNVGLIPAMGNYGTPSTPSFSFNIHKDSAIRLYNNVPYAGHVEHGGINKPPQKMLFKANITFEAVLKRELRRL